MTVDRRSRLGCRGRRRCRTADHRRWGSAAPAVGPAASVIDGVLAIAQVGCRRAGRDVGRLLERPAACARDAERHRAGFLAISRSRSCGRFAARPRPGTARAQSPRARIGPSIPHERRLARLARALRLLTDVNIVKRIIALAAGEMPSACWCFCGASGRGESLTRHAPQLVLIVEDESRKAELRAALRACVRRARRVRLPRQGRHAVRPLVPRGEQGRVAEPLPAMAARPCSQRDVPGPAAVRSAPGSRP